MIIIKAFCFRNIASDLFFQDRSFQPYPSVQSVPHEEKYFWIIFVINSAGVSSTK